MNTASFKAWDAMLSATAKTQRDANIAKGLAHHRERIAWLSEPAPKWSCGTPVDGDTARRLLAQSRDIVANPDLAYNSAP